MGLTPLQRLAYVLRKMRLLQLADNLWFLRLYLLKRRSNILFRKEHPDAPVPPPLMLYDIQGNCDLSGFYLSGEEHAREIARIMARELPAKPLRVLEWGCGPARVLQHLPAAGLAGCELWGSDYNSRTIDWCRRQLPDIRFVHHGLEPPIPAEEGSFDVIYCISVFTHLSEASHRKWVAEIGRLLKPDGLFIGTFHGAAYRTELTCEEQGRFDAGELVVRDRIEEGRKNFSAYHSDQVVRRLLGSFAEVKKHEGVACFRQTVWSAMKRGEGAARKGNRAAS